jgi:CBS domain-containing protein
MMALRLPQEHDMRIRDVMSSDVRVVKPDAPLSEVARTMRDEDIGAVPVALDDKLIGMVTDRDIVVRALAVTSDVSRIRARDVMSPKVLYCMDDETVEDVLRNMREEQVRRLPVVDRDKRLVGVVSLGDLSLADTHRSGDALAGISQPARS